MALDSVLTQVRACQICTDLPLGPRPLLQASAGARILIVGQAPGRKTHIAGRPFDDVSGTRLRDWLGVDWDSFYDPDKFAIIPMGFCYPGTGKSGDLPPRVECAPAWRAALLAQMPKLEMTVIIGRYARDWHLPDHANKSLTETVASWQSLPAGLIATPHPSPRNGRWLKVNPWFEDDVLPVLKRRVQSALGSVVMPNSPQTPVR